MIIAPTADRLLIGGTEMAKKYTKKCEVCLKTFTTQRANAKYCPSCRVIGKKKQEKARKLAIKEEQKFKKTNRERNLNKTLADLRKYNEKYGTNLSYGQFVAIKR